MQFAEPVHEIPVSVVARGGVLSGRQTLPFHDSAVVPPTAMQLAAPVQEMAAGEPGGDGSTVHALPFQDSASVPGEAKPTATQLVLLTQDTPESAASAPSAGIASIVQALPFHDSASVAMLLADGSYCPTAMQSDLLTQETQDRLAWSAPAGLSGLCTVQVEPFHVSARVTAFVPVPLVPTATQSDADGQATPLNRGASTVVGVFSRVQAVPFHRSAPTPPTAWHIEARGHTTADRSWSVFSSGVARCIQPAPFHCSASECVPLSPKLPPTAMQSAAVMHATPLRCPSAPGAPGLDTVAAARSGPAVARFTDAALATPATPSGADTRRTSPAASPRIRSARLMKLLARPRDPLP
jgi:hypothetical protein